MKPDYCFFIRPIGRRLDQIFDLLHGILQGNRDMSQELEAVQLQVAAIQTAVTAAVALLTDLSARVASSTSPQDLVNISTQLQASAEALSAAVTTNTPQ